jgi:hypothetical protein
MILHLEQIALNYENSAEGEKAREMLKWLKSDLKMQMTDEKGNVLKAGNNVPATPKAAVPTQEEVQKNRLLEQKQLQMEMGNEVMSTEAQQKKQNVPVRK